MATAVSIAAPNIVALAAIGARVWQRHSSRKHDRERHDLDAVRAILNDKAVALHRIAYALNDVRSHLTQHGDSFFTSPHGGERGEEIFEELQSVGRDADVVVERLAVRFGRRAAVTEAFTKADDATLEISRALGLLRMESAPDGSSAAERYLAESMTKTRAKLKEQRAYFNDAREAFIVEAVNLAGARLGEPDSVPRTTEGAPESRPTEGAPTVTDLTGRKRT